MSSPASQAVPSGPPYMPQIAQLGGIPSTLTDMPVSAVLLALFVLSAATHMTIFQLNRRRAHKFLFSAMLFGFSMARIFALSLRLAWAAHPSDVNLAIASAIFTAAGVLLIFIINLIFTRRVLRAWHPAFGWHRAVDWFFRGLIASIVCVLVIVIVGTVQSYFTLDTAIRYKDRDMQLFAGTYLALIAFLPIPVIIIGRLIPRKNPVEKFGAGRFRMKVALLLFTSTLLAFGATYRVAVNYMSLTNPRLASDPAPYHSKAAYYCVNFVIELVVVFTYAIVRFDRRFHVPDGAKGPGDYSGIHVVKEEDVFGPAPEDVERAVEKESERENGTLGSVEKERVNGDAV